MIIKTVGRNQDNNIVVNDGKVSRTHLQLVQDDMGNVSVVDLGSANGTFVNGNRISSETRLKPGDVLRIGDTTLNWQSYFSAPQPVSVPHPSSTSPTPQSVRPSKKNSKGKKTWIYVVAGVLMLLVAGGVVLILNKNHKSAIDKERKIEETKNLELEASNAERDAAKAAAEYEEAQKKAAITKSVKDQRRADSLKVVYKKSLEEADRLKKEIDKIKAEKDKAEKAKNEALKKSEEMEKAKRNSDAIANEYKGKNKKLADDNEAMKKQLRDANAAKEAAEAAAADVKTANKKAKEKAEKERDEAKTKATDAEKRIELTESFYNELNNARAKGRLKAVRESLKINVKQKKSDDEQYKEIVNQFNKAKNNEERQKIINAIKAASKGKNKEKTVTTDATESTEETTE
jgi:pSer/pThr/pTyr-binding forkhead associated (FHA) protein